ncbi:hypothetical protein F511_15425 [Dorcoceras hygrometricum]|uniref:Uncharacterized protein n=1 Tax=Dorcoceras hygrometricum TaxID=472368 RepID=A0A2Z7A5P6_9LAMI|nr:hypothetical protein F511_15425 [Dorcoceras hygrometricum]
MSLFDLQDVCMVIGSIATLDLPMVVDLIRIYGLKGPYWLTTTNWFLQALSVIPRGSWGDVARRFTMIRWPPLLLSHKPPPPPPPRVAGIRFGQFDEENPSMQISSGLLVQADEGIPPPDISLIEGSVSAASDVVCFARWRGVARSVIACIQKSTNSFVVWGLKRRRFEVSAPVYRAACDRWLCNAAFSFLFRFLQRLVLATGLLLRVFSLPCFQISLACGWSLFRAFVQIPPTFNVSDQTSPMVARRRFVAEHFLVHALVS